MVNSRLSGRTLAFFIAVPILLPICGWRSRRDSNPRTFITPDSFQDCSLRPAWVLLHIRRDWPSPGIVSFHSHGLGLRPISSLTAVCIPTSPTGALDRVRTDASEPLNLINGALYNALQSTQLNGRNVASALPFLSYEGILLIGRGFAPRMRRYLFHCLIVRAT